MVSSKTYLDITKHIFYLAQFLINHADALF